MKTSPMRKSLGEQQRVGDSASHGDRGRARARQRLDVVLVAQGLVESREKAARLILAGSIMVDGQRVDKAGALVDPAQWASRHRSYRRG